MNHWLPVRPDAELTAWLPDAVRKELVHRFEALADWCLDDNGVSGPRDLARGHGFRDAAHVLRDFVIDNCPAVLK